jgi:hypothetical protein
VDAFDPDRDTFSIKSVSTPQHGTVTLEGMEWYYTPDTSYDGSDQFSVTVADSTGEATTRIVQVYDVRPRAFEFDLPLNWQNSDPPQPAGRLKLSTTVAGAFTGKASVFGEDFTLRGSFNEFDEAVLEFDRRGLPPMVANLKLLPGLDGEMHLTVEIQAPEIGPSYLAEGLPVGDAETAAGVGGSQYTVVLPLQGGESLDDTTATRSSREVASETPRGDGFLIGSVSKKGRARFTGRTGDGQTFTVGGRLQRNRQLQVSTNAGGKPRDYIVGQLEFERDEIRSVGGSLGWISYRSAAEYYRQDFTRVAAPKGAAYRKSAANPFGERSASANLRVQFMNESGTQFTDSTVSLNKAGRGSSPDSSFNLKLNRKSGLFRGTLRSGGAGLSSRFMGALVQPLKQGQGHLMLGGPVGAVTVSAPSSD